MIHMVTIKLSSSNYLLWKSQLLPLLESQGLLGHADGSLEPPPLFDPPTSQTPNTKHLAWKATDQHLLNLLISSLIEEAMVEAVGLSTSREVWTALENTFSHHSKAREMHLKDDLQLMKRGTRPVTAYTRAFKALCDQFHAIGRPIDGTDKLYYFELFQKSLESLTPSTATFTSSHGSSQREGGFSRFRRGHGNGSSHEFSSHGQGRAQTTQGHRPPWFQICRLDDHYANQCRQRYDQPQHDPSAHLAEAFNTSCSMSGNEASNWFLDTRASTHMTPAYSTLDQSTTYTESPNGKGEFTSNYFKVYLRTSGIHHQLSCPYTPAQNGRAKRKHHHVTKTGLALLFHSHIFPRFWVDVFSTATYIINRLPAPLLGGKSPFELLYGSSPNYENFDPFGFRCLNPTISRLCITRHAQFDETHFPFLTISQAQPLSSLQFSNFLEPSLPPPATLPSSPMPHSQHITQSGSTPCGICTNPVDEPLRVNDSLTGPYLPHSDPSLVSLELTTKLPTPAPVAATPMASHPLITRAKLVFSKIVILQILLSWDPMVFSLLYLHPLSSNDSNLVLRILLGSLLWMKKFKPCKLIVLGFWFIALPTPTLWVPNGCFGPNTCLMDQLSVLKLVLFPKAIHRYLVSTTLTLLVLLSRLQLSVLSSLLL
ncbi:hypothetical protein AAG906_021620 [Vitis piasezkii]